MAVERYKVWRNPRHRHEPPHYMGEVSPADGAISLSAADLVELGFPSGTYTVRVPDAIAKAQSKSRWARIEIR